MVVEVIIVPYEGSLLFGLLMFCVGSEGKQSFQIGLV